MNTPILSDDAKAVLGSVLNNGMVLRFQMIESRPTKRAQAAIDELVAVGAACEQSEPMRADGSRARSWKACWPITKEYRDAANKAKDFQLNEPIPKR